MSWPVLGSIGEFVQAGRLPASTSSTPVQPPSPSWVSTAVAQACQVVGIGDVEHDPAGMAGRVHIGAARVLQDPVGVIAAHLGQVQPRPWAVAAGHEAVLQHPLLEHVHALVAVLDMGRQPRPVRGHHVGVGAAETGRGGHAWEDAAA